MLLVKVVHVVRMVSLSNPIGNPWQGDAGEFSFLSQGVTIVTWGIVHTLNPKFILRDIVLQECNCTGGCGGR